jgi:hypothetical protein
MSVESTILEAETWLSLDKEVADDMTLIFIDFRIVWKQIYFLYKLSSLSYFCYSSTEQTKTGIVFMFF